MGVAARLLKLIPRIRLVILPEPKLVKEKKIYKPIVKVESVDSELLQAMTSKNPKMNGRNILMGNFKAPFLPLPKPYHGFSGIVLEDADSGEMQCHICGEWFTGLSWHVGKAHRTDIQIPESYNAFPQWSTSKRLKKAYRDMFGLLQKTPLMSNEMRMRLSAQSVWSGNAKYLARARLARNKSTLGKSPHRIIANQKRNQDDTCFIQVLRRINDVAASLKRRPIQTELKDQETGITYSGVIRRVYGSWTQALKLTSLAIGGKRLGSVPFPLKGHYPEKFLLECIRIYRARFGVNPTQSAADAAYIPGIDEYDSVFGSFQNAIDLALKSGLYFRS